MAREICELPADAVEVSRKLLKLPKEDILRRIGQEEHLFAERMRAPGVVAAFKSFLSRKNDSRASLAQQPVSRTAKF